MSHEEKYEYMWLDEYKKSPVVYSKFEADKDILPHVKDLYFQGIPHLENVKQRNRLAQILSEYNDIFAKDSNDVGRTKLVTHEIDTGDAKPVHQRCRRLAKAHIKVIQEQIKKLSEAGIIRPSNSNWAANCVVVNKKDNTKRMCIDYRGLNAVTVNPDSYLLPRIDDTLDALEGAKYFCTLDLIQGYHQVEIEESSKHKTAFHAPYCNPSQWEYNYMPFGLVRAPRTFQRLMDRVIQGLEYEMALCYIDDIIIFASSLDQCMDRLVTIFDRLRSANLKLKAKKCILFSRQVKFLGHVISEEGITTDPDKVQSVVDWHPPRTTRQVRSFVGMVNYYNRFIKDYATIAAPLQELMKKNVRFVWTSKQQNAFETLKTKLVTAPIMAYPQKDGMFILDTDASDYAYGAVLSQLQPNKHGELVEKTIAYASKKFSDREAKYCARRRELLAIINFVKHFEVYLTGVTFTIRTDHASLKYIKTVQTLPPQFFRWVMYLEEFSYKIEIRKGVLHANADGMSRGCHGKGCICDDLVRYEKKHNVKEGDVLDGDLETIDAYFTKIKENFDTKMSTGCDVEQCFVNAFKLQPKYSSQELAAMQVQDRDIAPLYNRFKEDPNTKPTWSEISEYSATTKSYFNEWNRLVFKNDVLYRIWESANGLSKVHQLIVPRQLQLEFCERIHNSNTTAHMGREKTQHAAAHLCFWGEIFHDIG